jgi:hypothetical protein
MFMRVQPGTYESSAGICQDFCGRYGAAVFFWNALDVAAAGDERWLGWNAEICFGEEAVDREPVRMLGEVLKSWKEARTEW